MGFKITVQAIPGSRGPWTTSKGSGALICCLREYHTIYLRMVLHINDRYPVPVYWRIHPMNLTTLCCHQPHGEFNSTLQEGDLSPEYLAVGSSHPRALKFLGLLWHSRHECAGLACHCAGFINVSHKDAASEEANEEVYLWLKCTVLYGTIPWMTVWVTALNGTVTSATEFRYFCVHVIRLLPPT